MNKVLFRMIIAGVVLTVGLTAARVSAQTERDETIRVETSLVSVPVIVSDRQGRYISGLSKENFAIFVDGKAQETAFFAAEEEPLRIAILLDTSRSTEMILGKIKKAAREFLRILNPADSAMIVTFDYDVHLISPLTSDKKLLERAIKEVGIGEIPGTVMRDAVLETVAGHLAATKGRKAIILLTDGKDFGSYAYTSELLRALEESDVMIYPIFYETTIPVQMMNRNRRNGPFGGGRRGGNFPRPRTNDDRIRRRDAVENERARELLQRIADLTAGRFYEKKENELEAVFLTITAELRGQYRLGFYPDESLNDENTRQIKVRVNRTDIAVRSRGSYRLKK
jgi:VWFA-related protein